MEAAQVADLMAALARNGLRACIGGGWGVDALVGRQTRPHADLDLAIDARQLEQVLGLLRGQGFEAAVDWLPVRVEMAHGDGRRVDVHPVVFGPDGGGLQAGLDGAEFAYPADAFTRGLVGGLQVECLTAEQQLVFHQGYPARDVDRPAAHRLAGLPRTRGTLEGGTG